MSNPLDQAHREVTKALQELGDTEQARVLKARLQKLNERRELLEKQGLLKDDISIESGVAQDGKDENLPQVKTKVEDNGSISCMLVGLDGETLVSESLSFTTSPPKHDVDDPTENIRTAAEEVVGKAKEMADEYSKDFEEFQEEYLNRVEERLSDQKEKWEKHINSGSSDSGHELEARLYLADALQFLGIVMQMVAQVDAKKNNDS